MSVGVEIHEVGSASGALEAAMTAALGGFDGATVSVVAGGSRGQSKNTLIAKVQQKQLRDPFYLDDQAKEAIRFALKGLTASQYSTRLRALKLAGELMLNAIGRNVEKQQNPGGQSFKDLSKKYAEYKKRKFGHVVPILRATGDLLGGLRVVIDGLT